MSAPIEQELKPCPFCGGDVHYSDGEHAHIVCLNGQCPMMDISLKGSFTCFDTLVKSWNTRAIPKPSGEVSPLKSIVLAHKNVDNIAARNIKAAEKDTSQEDIWQARRDLDAAIRRAYPAVGVDIVRRHNPDFKPSGEVNLSLTKSEVVNTLSTLVTMAGKIEGVQKERLDDLVKVIESQFNAQIRSQTKGVGE